MNSFSIDTVEISEVKETYERKPNRLIPIFIYSMALLVIAMVVYGRFSTVESVTSAFGMIVPKESEVALFTDISGRVAQICCNDGQVVNAGDIIMQLDATDYEDRLTELSQKKEDILWQIDLIEKFLSGIEQNRNTFNADPSSNEYSYYIQYCLFDLELQNERAVTNSESSEISSPLNAVAASPITLRTISDFIAQRDLLLDQIAQLDSELAQINLCIARCELKATHTGIVNLTSGLKPGADLQAGTIVAKIIPDTGNRVAIYMENADILNISVGDEVKYCVNIANVSSPMWVGGRIENIPTSAISSDGNFPGYFVVDGSLDTEQFSYDKNEKTLLPGMQVEVKIVTKKITLLRYLLNKINLF